MSDESAGGAEQAAGASRRPAGRRWLRRAVRALGLIALLVVGTVSLLASSDVRRFLLARAIAAAGGAVDGELRVETARWPKLSRVELGGVTLVRDGSTALEVERAVVDVDLPAALLRRRLTIRELELRVTSLDGPALAASERSGAPADSVEPSAPAPSGSAPSGPLVPRAVDVRSLRVSVERAALGEAVTVSDWTLAGSGRWNPTEGLSVSLRELAGQVSDPAARIDEGTLELANDTVTARFRGAFRGDPFRLDARTERENRMHVGVEKDAGESDLPALSLDLVCDVAPSFANVRSVEFRGLAGAQAKDLPRFEGDLEGTFDLATRATTLALDLRPNDWIPRGRLRLSQSEGVVRVDTLSVRMVGIDVEGGAGLENGTITSRVRARLTDADELARAFPAASFPGLEATLVADAGGTQDSLAWRARLDARLPDPDPDPDPEAGTASARPGQMFELHADLRSSGRPDSVIARIDGIARGYTVRARANASRRADGTAIVRTRPVRVKAGTEPGEPVGPTGELRLDPASGSLDVEDFRVEGDFGELRASGRADDRAIEARFQWQSRGLPAALAPADPVHAAPSADTTTYRLRGTARMERGGEPRARIAGNMVLPGTEAFASRLPPDLDLRELGPPTGTFELAGRGRADGAWLVDGRVDFGETVGVDSLLFELAGRVGLAKTPGSAGDSLSVRGRGALLGAVRFDARADRVGEAVDVLGDVAVSVRPLAGRLGLEGEWDGTVSAHGSGVVRPGAAPRISAELTGALESPGLRIPSITGNVRSEDGRRVWDLGAPSGVELSGTKLEIARVRASHPDDGAFPLSYELEANGPELAIAHRGVARGADPWTVELETLVARVRDRDLRLVSPSTISGVFEIGGLDADVLLEGSLGRVHVRSNEGSEPALQLEGTLELPAELPGVELPGPMPRHLEFDVRASASHDLEGRISSTGIRLAPDVEIAASLRGALSRDSLAVEVEAREGARRVLEARGSIPKADLTAVIGNGNAPWRFDASVDSFPVPSGWIGTAPGRVARADASIRVAGAVAGPEGSFRSSLRFPGWKGFEDAIVAAQADWTADPGTAETGPRSTPPSATDPWRIRLSGSASFQRSARELLKAGLDLPLLAGPAPEDSAAGPAGQSWRIVPDPDGDVHLEVLSSDLRLEDLTAFLPEDVRARGGVLIDVRGDGPAADPRLAGEVRGDDLRVDLADGSRVTATVRARVDGSAAGPKVGGSLRVTQGVIRIPENPRALHPTSGTALLAGIDAPPATPMAESPGNGTAGAPPNGTATGSAAGRGSLSGRPPPVLPPTAIDVSITVPSGLWLTGAGLEVELGGDLRLLGTVDEPEIHGDLRALQGSFVFLGRRFEVKTGEAVFVGPPDPRLDIEVETRVQDVVARVLVRGTASAPELELVSDPEMTQGDITSLLLFGRTLAELDNDQLGLVRQRTTEIAAAFGVARLESQVRKRTGVDVLTWKPGETDGSHGSLVVGKYLGPRLLLRYEQTFEDASAFVVNLEYLLTQALRVASSWGREVPSGVELNWTREY